jgi:hypothetical protein
MGDDGAQVGVGGVGAVERGEVTPRRAKERHEAPDQRCGGEGDLRLIAEATESQGLRFEKRPYSKRTNGFGCHLRVHAFFKSARPR